LYIGLKTRRYILTSEMVLLEEKLAEVEKRITQHSCIIVSNEYTNTRRTTMTRRITNDEYLTLALRYNEQRTINDSLQREITELKEKNEIWGKVCQRVYDRMDELKDKLDEFAVNEEDKYNAGTIWVSRNLDNDTGEQQ
jgi:hypothetical protein